MAPRIKNLDAATRSTTSTDTIDLGDTTRMLGLEDTTLQDSRDLSFHLLVMAPRIKNLDAATRSTTSTDTIDLGDTTRMLGLEDTTLRDNRDLSFQGVRPAHARLLRNGG
jgi:uncharacterized protein YaaQ